MSVRNTSDEELACAARSGEVAALGMLIERYRPALFASALALMRDAPAAQDAVQDTALVALRRIGGLREPTAVGPWLHAIVRRCCLQELRRVRSSPRAVALDAVAEVADPAADLVEELERAELGEWVWAALAELPESIRVTAMLRFFGSWPASEEIAAVLGVPVGTVRSRLAHARRRLSAALLATSAAERTQARRFAEEEERAFRAALAELNAGRDIEPFAGAFSPDVRIDFLAGGGARGRDVLRASLEDDLLAGVQLHVTSVMASGGITVLEGRFVNPASDPLRCPPATCQVHYRQSSETTRAQLWFADRSTANVPVLTPR